MYSLVFKALQFHNLIIKPIFCGYHSAGVKKAKSARRSSPFKFGYNNIKMLFDHKKMLPRRKCAASVQSYKEDDVETDDSFICEYELTLDPFVLYLLITL